MSTETPVLNRHPNLVLAPGVGWGIQSNLTDEGVSSRDVFFRYTLAGFLCCSPTIVTLEFHVIYIHVLYFQNTRNDHL